MKRNNFVVMAKLVKLVKSLFPIMLLAVFLGVLGFLASIFIPVLGGYAILNVLGIDKIFSLKTIFMTITVLALFRGILHYGEQSCNHYLAFKLLAIIRDQVFSCLRKLAPAKLEGKDKGNLISIITSDIELLEVFYAHTLSPILIAFFVSLLLVIYFFSFHWLLGIIAFVAYLTIGVLVPLVASKKVKEIGQDYREEFGNLNSLFLDNMRGINEILQFNCGQHRLNGINQRTNEMLYIEENMKKHQGKNKAFTGFLILFFSFLMMGVSVLLFQTQIIDFKAVLIPTITIFFSFGSVLALANLGSGLTQTLAAGNRVLNILEEEPLIVEVTGKEEISFKNARCQNLDFSYEKEEILKDLNIKIPAQKIVGIVGKSGSGKSTFLKLLMRFWDADKGHVFISDVDIKNINTKNLRELESFVTQTTQLFKDTIENNVRIAKLNASEDEIITACQKASIHDFIMSLPKGYQTNIGELGDTLSGGERQRIGLARAFLHNAPLMLLDEPTSNLDSLNEGIILKSLKEENTQTVVLVSHRESTMKIADKVYSVENGRVS